MRPTAYPASSAGATNHRVNRQNATAGNTCNIQRPPRSCRSTACKPARKQSLEESGNNVICAAECRHRHPSKLIPIEKGEAEKYWIVKIVKRYPEEADERKQEQPEMMS